MNDSKQEAAEQRYESIYTYGCHCQPGPNGEPIAQTSDEVLCRLHGVEWTVQS